jgi:hypothetical protein
MAGSRSHKNTRSSDVALLHVADLHPDHRMVLVEGYSLAPAGQVGPFNYGNVVFAALLGWLIWGETLDGLTLAGAVLTCSAGIIATYHSERHI